MKQFKLLSTLFLIGLLASCGGKKGDSENSGSEMMEPETTMVSGDLGACFTVVEREYKITDNGGWGNMLTVELERTNAPLPFELTSSTEVATFGHSMSKPFIKVGFGIEFLDIDGNVLGKVSATGSGLSASYDPDEAVDLVKLKPGEKGSIRFSVNDAEKDAMYFRISSAYAEDAGWGESSGGSSSDTSGDVEQDETDSSSSSYSSSSSDDGDFDDFLAAYEKYINNYIAVMKKAQNGDLSAMEEAASLMADAEEYSRKLQSVSGDLSPTQLAKFQKLQQKLLKAAQ